MANKMMNMNAKIQDWLRAPQGAFDIIEEFKSLSPKRRALLSDQLFMEGQSYFEGTVKLLWPEASAKDTKKLQKLLTTLKKSEH